MPYKGLSLTEKQYKRLNVFLSSPGDVEAECNIATQVITQLNASSYTDPYLLVPLRYNKIVPAKIGELPQISVNQYMLEPAEADIFICILWSRIGTAFVDHLSGREYRSGTEYEFSQAYQGYQGRKWPIILLYRCTRSVSPLDSDPEQLAGVQDFFRSIIGSEGQYVGIFNTYESYKDFEHILFRDLLTVLHKNFQPDTSVLPHSGVQTIPEQGELVSIKQIKGKFLEANAELRNYPCVVGGKYGIERNEVAQILEWLDTKEASPRLGMLIDKPGSGKTVVLAEVLKRLESNQQTVLAIKSDYLSGIKTNRELQERLELPASVEDCARLLAADEQVVIIIDQLDALSVALSQDFATLDLIHSLVLTLITLDNVYVVLSCREFDISFDPHLSTLKHQQHRKFTLTPLTDEQVNHALHAIGILNADRFPIRMRQLLTLPLHLSIYADLVANENIGVLSEEFFSLHQLYEHLWQRRIETASVPQLSETINTLVGVMQYHRQLAAPVGILDKSEYKQAAIYLQHINFIRKERGNYIFFHQTLFDYCYARQFVAEGNSIADVILASPQGLFERSQMIQVLAYLRVSQPEKYLTQINHLLFSKRFRIHLRLLLIEWVASLPDPSEEEHLLAKRLLNDQQDQVDFLRAAQGNKMWFDRLNDGFIVSLPHNGDSSKVTVETMNYLASIISQRKSEVLSLLSPYVGRSEEWNNIILYCLAWVENWNG